MKTHSKCLFVPVKSAEIINNALHWKEGDPAYYKLDQNSCISYEVPFPDERIIRISCNTMHWCGAPEKYKTLPWTEAILLKETQNGFVELCHSEIKDEFFRCWELEYENERYIVNVFPEGDSKQREYEARYFTIPTLKRLGVSLEEISEELDYRGTAGITYKGWNDQLYYYTNEQLQYAENYWNEVTVSTINKKYLIDFTREVMNHCADHFCSNFTDQCDYAAAILAYLVKNYVTDDVKLCVVHGKFDHRTHVWLRIEGDRYDPTVDQFGNQYSIYSDQFYSEKYQKIEEESADSLEDLISKSDIEYINNNFCIDLFPEVYRQR